MWAVWEPYERPPADQLPTCKGLVIVGADRCDMLTWGLTSCGGDLASHAGATKKMQFPCRFFREAMPTTQCVCLEAWFPPSTA